MISVHDAPVLIPQLSVDDLMICIRKIGLADADAVLALAIANKSGWTQIVGIEINLKLSVLTLLTLSGRGPDVLGRHLLHLLNLLVQASIHVIVVEEPEDFEPISRATTPDGRLCICFRHLQLEIYR